MASLSKYLHVQTSGDPAAESILFLHALGANSVIWNQQVQALQDFHCLVIDLPGHGRSSEVAWRSMRETAKLMAELITEQANNGHAHIAGLSLGSYVALQLLADRPDVVDRVVLTSVNTQPLPNERFVSMMGYLMSPFLRSRRFARLNADGLNLPEDDLDDYTNSLKGMSIRGYLDASRDAAAFRTDTVIPAADNPVLLLAGEYEHPLIRQSLTELAAELPNAIGRFVPDIGHGWSGEEPELFGETLRGFYRDDPLPKELLLPQEMETNHAHEDTT